MTQNRMIITVALIVTMLFFGSLCGCRETVPSAAGGERDAVSDPVSVPEFSSAQVSVPGKQEETPSQQTAVTSAKPNTAAVSSAAPKTQKKSGKSYLLRVNRTQNIVTVLTQGEDGNYNVPVKAMVCSVGKGGATPTGTFHTKNKYVWRALVGGVYGQYATRITGSILFHSVPYFSQKKSDLEYSEYNKLGTAASLGCVRLSVADAKWIYDHCPLGTTVTIYDSTAVEPLARPNPIRIDTSDTVLRGWDPTDPDAANPWKKVKPAQPKEESKPSSKPESVPEPPVPSKPSAPDEPSEPSVPTEPEETDSSEQEGEPSEAL